MDIEAKHIQADKDGVRITELTERSYREKMWSHRPLIDFWAAGALSRVPCVIRGVLYNTGWGFPPSCRMRTDKRSEPSF